MTIYTLLYRPPSSFTLPRVPWTLISRPTVAGFERRQDLPVATGYRFGLLAFDRPLDALDIEQFELVEVAR